MAEWKDANDAFNKHHNLCPSCGADLSKEFAKYGGEKMCIDCAIELHTKEGDKNNGND